MTSTSFNETTAWSLPYAYGVTAYSVHPGWARSNFDSGGSFGARVVLTLMKLTVYPFVTDSNEESAQTTLHCLLADDAPNHSGAYFSQHSVLYRDKECRIGGWPMDAGCTPSCCTTKALLCRKSLRRLQSWWRTVPVDWRLSSVMRRRLSCSIQRMSK